MMSHVRLRSNVDFERAGAGDVAAEKALKLEFTWAKCVYPEVASGGSEPSRARAASACSAQRGGHPAH
eukprot:12358496-Alexandrium_andersonii.AAC.1